MVDLLDVYRDWFKSYIGLQEPEFPAATSFCSAFFGTTAPVIIIEDTTKDDRFASHPFVTGAPFVRFYAGARLEVHGETVGTLCAYDLVPRTVDEGKLRNLQILAIAIVQHLNKRIN